jgi:hypothetical protein
LAEASAVNVNAATVSMRLDTNANLFAILEDLIIWIFSFHEEQMGEKNSLGFNRVAPY